MEFTDKFMMTWSVFEGSQMNRLCLLSADMEFWLQCWTVSSCEREMADEEWGFNHLAKTQTHTHTHRQTQRQIWNAYSVGSKSLRPHYKSYFKVNESRRFIFKP